MLNLLIILSILTIFFWFIYTNYILLLKKIIDSKNDIVYLSLKITWIFWFLFLFSINDFSVTKDSYYFWVSLAQLDLKLVFISLLKIVLSIPSIISIILITATLNRFDNNIKNKENKKQFKNFLLFLFTSTFIIFYIYLSWLLAFSMISINKQIKDEKILNELISDIKKKPELNVKSLNECPLNWEQIHRPNNSHCIANDKNNAWECNTWYYEKDNQCLCTSWKYTCDNSIKLDDMEKRKKELDDKIVKNLSTVRTEETRKEYNNLIFEAKKLVQDLNIFMNDTCVCKKE